MLRDVSNVNNWHPAMLNDVDRNVKFDLAIREAVAALAPRSGACGARPRRGSGLLSMMGPRAGRGQGVRGRAQRAALAARPRDAAAERVRRSRERVSWLAKSSRDVALADLDGAPCDVLVSETLGVTVLDEQALGFMVDARARPLRARARRAART